MKTTKKAKKPVVTSKAIKRAKPRPKELTFMQKIIEIGQKKVIPLWVLAAFIIIALSVIVSILPGTIAANNTDQKSVLGIVTTFFPPSKPSIKATETSITITWQTGITNNGADYTNVYWDRKNTPSRNIPQTGRISKSSKAVNGGSWKYTKTKSGLRYNHKVYITGGLSRRTLYRAGITTTKGTGSKEKYLHIQLPNTETRL